jgi:hypothetical protein
VLRPGERIPLVFRIDLPLGRTDRQVSCLVKTDHPQFPEWPYVVRYTNYPNARIVPDRVNLGTCSVGSALKDGSSPALHEVEAWLETYAPEGRPLPRPGRVRSPEGLFIALEEQPLIEAPEGQGFQRARYRLQIIPRHEAPATGARTETLEVPISDGSSATAVVTWEVTAPLACSPSQLHFGMVDSGEAPKVRAIWVRALDGKPFSVLSIESGSPGLVGPTQGEGLEGRSSQHLIQLALRVPDGFNERAITGRVLIRTDQVACPELSVPWAAFVRPSGRP